MMNRLEAAARQALEWIEAATAVLSHTSTAIQGGLGAEAEGVGGCSVKVLKDLREALAEQQAAEPNAVLVEGFGRVAMRKLNDLHEKGYAINGVSIATINEAGETNLGAVTTGGRVLWWPQQPAMQAAELVDKVAIMQRIVDSQTGHTRTVAREPEQQATCNPDLQVWVIPKGKGRGQFSWEPQDERFWTRMEPAVKQSLTVHPAPTQQPLTDDAKDAERYRWLKSRMMGADLDWNESGACALVFEWPRDVPIGADCDRNIDNAVEAAHGITSKEGGAA